MLKNIYIIISAIIKNILNKKDNIFFIMKLEYNNDKTLVKFKYTNDIMHWDYVYACTTDGYCPDCMWYMDVLEKNCKYRDDINKVNILKEQFNCYEKIVEFQINQYVYLKQYNKEIEERIRKRNN